MGRKRFSVWLALSVLGGSAVLPHMAVQQDQAGQNWAGGGGASAGASLGSLGAGLTLFSAGGCFAAQAGSHEAETLNLLKNLKPMAGGQGASEGLFARRGLSPVFIKTAQYRPWEQIRFGLPPAELELAENAVAVMMYESPKVRPSQGIQREVLAASIKAELDRVFDVLPQLGVRTPLTNTDKQWLYAMGVAHWSLKHTIYDNGRQTIPGKDFCRPAQATLNLPAPAGKCGDLARLCRDLMRIVGKEVGLQAYYARGGMRRIHSPELVSHAWVFVRVGGSGTFADVNPHRIPPGQATRLARELVLPRTPEEMEFFMATHLSRSGDATNGKWSPEFLTVGDVEEQWKIRGPQAVDFIAGDRMGAHIATDQRTMMTGRGLIEYHKAWRSDPALEAHRRNLIPLLPLVSEGRGG